MPDAEHVEHFDAPSPDAYPPSPRTAASDDADGIDVSPRSSGARNTEHAEYANDHGLAGHAEHSEFAEHAEHAEHLEHSEHAEHAEHAEHTEHTEHAEHAEHTASDTDLGRPSSRPSLSRRSTMMLREDELPVATQTEPEEGPLSRAREGEQVDLDRGSSEPHDGLVETVIEWKQGGQSVFVTGSFTGWRQMIPLRRFDDSVFAVVLKLAPGTHRLRFVVDGELRCSDDMNTATDSMGNLVNYMEVEPPSPDEFAEYAEGELAPEHEYTRVIPEIFADPEALDRYSSIEFTPPPQLPPHLDGVILNTNWSEKDNNSVLPIPNHVVLNHLATTSIKHNVLAVASVSRYHAKYVTQILYSPIEGI